MSKFKPTILPFLLFTLSFLLRLSLIGKGPYHVDCLNLAIQAQKTLETHQLHFLFGTGYPLTVLLGASFQWLGKILFNLDPVAAVNLMSVVMSSLCIPAFYHLAAKFFDTTTAVLSAITLSVTPIFLGISVYGMSHAPSLFFLITAVSALASFLKNNQVRHLILSAVLMGLMGASRLQDAALLFFPLSYLYARETKLWQRIMTNDRQKKIYLTNFIVYWCLALAIILAFHLPYVLEQRSNPFHQQFSRYVKIGLTENFDFFVPEAVWLTITYLYLSLTPAGLLLAFLGFLLFYRGKSAPHGFLFLWFIVPFYFYGNTFGTAPRFLTVAIPPLILTASHLVSRGIQKNFAFKIAFVLVFASMIYVSFHSIYPVLQFRHQKELLPEFARWAAQKTEPSALIIAGDEGLFLEYYGHRRIMKRPDNRFIITDKELQDFKAGLDEKLKNDTPVYITANGLFTYNLYNRFSDFMKRHYRLDYIGKKDIEDWHYGCIFQFIFPNHLFRILLKK